MSRRWRWAAAGGLGLAMSVVVAAQANVMNKLGADYVKLVLAIGEHDVDYVDAYYGPPEWRKEAEVKRMSLLRVGAEGAVLARSLVRAAPGATASEMTRLRHQYLTRQVEALRDRVRMRTGRAYTFDEESRALYDAVAPAHAEAEFQRVLTDLEAALPGSGPLVDRLEAFRSRYVIPREKLEAVFNAAIEGCRSRTLRHIQLPREERFTVEYVTDKSWSGYNWYQGEYHSLIQVNTDLPIYIDRAIDLACHEGYPGHHVYNVLLEKNLVRDREWMEFSVYALFSPQSLIAEGSANYGIEVAFPRQERLEFERRVLFPAAGLDPSGVERYYDVLALVDRLSYAGNEAARRYVDGAIDAAGAAAWLEKYGLYTKPRAEQRVHFIDQYRSYVINYNLGKDMVAAYVESKAAGDPAKRWTEFEKLLASPRLPSGLIAEPGPRLKGRTERGQQGQP